METNPSNHSIDEPNSKRPKIESNISTSSKSKASDDCPLLMLPPHILAKVIAYVPVTQWPALELLYDFRPATLIAWRQLRTVNLDRDFMSKPESEDDESSSGKTINSILHKLNERSLFLTSLSEIDIQSDDPDLRAGVIHSLAQFEHLQSIAVGNRTLLAGDANERRGVRLENVVEFLESTGSRTSLKELHLFYVNQTDDDRSTMLVRFASTFASGRDIQLPLQLEKFTFASSDRLLRIRLDTLDTTRLTDVRLGKASIEPDQLASLIERASNLHRIGLSFLLCLRDNDCNDQRLQANKRLLAALASHENLIAISVGCHILHNCKCVHFESEFIGMLKTIGRRGQLRHLALEDYFLECSSIDSNETCATIRDYIPYLQSIKLDLCGCEISNGSLSDIVGLTELQDIHLLNNWVVMETPSIVGKIAQLPHLKRLALDGLCFGIDEDSFEDLAATSTLTDLRIRYAYYDKSGVYQKWSEGFAANLRVLMVYEAPEDESDSEYSSDEESDEEESHDEENDEEHSNVEEKEEEDYDDEQKDEEEEDDDEEGLVRLLEKAVQLRVLILHGVTITDRSLMAIAQSCPELETLGLRSTRNEITVQHLQQIVDNCPKLKRLDGFSRKIRNQLQFPKCRKICDVDMDFREFDLDDSAYN